MEAFRGGGEVAETERRRAVKPGGADEVAFEPLDVRQFPSPLRERQYLLRLPHPKKALGEEAGNLALGVLVAIREKIASDRRRAICDRGSPRAARAVPRMQG